LGCIGPYTIGWKHPFGYDWPLWWQGFEGGFEATEMINQYGLNEWELLGGMVPWLVMGSREGILTGKRFDALKPISADLERNTESYLMLKRKNTLFTRRP
jgi:hypothetical protein